MMCMCKRSMKASGTNPWRMICVGARVAAMRRPSICASRQELEEAEAQLPLQWLDGELHSCHAQVHHGTYPHVLQLLQVRLLQGLQPVETCDSMGCLKTSPHAGAGRRAHVH